MTRSLAAHLARREAALDLLAWWGDAVRARPYVASPDWVNQLGGWPHAAWHYAVATLDFLDARGITQRLCPPRDRRPLPLP